MPLIHIKTTNRNNHTCCQNPKSDQLPNRTILTKHVHHQKSITTLLILHFWLHSIQSCWHRLIYYYVWYKSLLFLSLTKHRSPSGHHPSLGTMAAGLRKERSTVQNTCISMHKLEVSSLEQLKARVWNKDVDLQDRKINLGLHLRLCCTTRAH